MLRARKFRIFVFFVFVFLCCSTSARLKKDPACGTELGCFHDCNDTGCSFLITWSYRPAANAVEMSLNFQLEELYYFNQRWHAIGFSDDTEMGDDSIIECNIDHTFYWLADVDQSYNKDRYNVKLIRSKLGLTEVSGKVNNATLTCNFTRDMTVPNEPRIFPLNTLWYILVASGPMQDGQKLMHEKEPIVSPWKIDFTAHEDVQSQERTLILIKLHACFMIFAWVLVSSISIVIARYYKTAWTVAEVGAGTKVWFKVHRVMMVVCTTMVTAGFVCIWVQLKELSSLLYAPFYQKAHPILGIIIMGLTIINPIIAVLRPKEGTLSRPVFKWSHSFVGTVVYILAIINIIIGVTLKKSPSPFFMIWILVGFAVYQVLFEVFLEMYDCHFVQSEEPDYVAKDLDVSTVSTIESETSIAPSVSHRRPGPVFKMIALFFHTLVIIAFGSCMIVFTVIN